MTRPEWPALGATFDGGSFATTKLIAGRWTRGRWRGVRASDGAAVLISTRTVSRPMEMVRRFEYSGPGVAPVLFAGPPDRDAPLVRANKQVDFGVIEMEPHGSPLDTLAGTVSAADIVRVGLGLADTIALASHAGRILAGIRPEVTYAERGEDGWRFSGVAPAGYNLVRHEIDEGAPAFMPDTYQPPEIWDDERNGRVDVYSLALVLWYLATGTHAYSHRPSQEENMDLDRREPWTGPVELGPVLASALVADPERRPSIDELRERLRAVARSR
ncbi:MAG: hypothetical protein F9K40_00550 [Kofleriaceae bacterium]|nr:MAG: hypothetical protein F9K40_00550 [Kofleriaceae bacterium]MBZ0231767.1 hypothetical protein [Kofleriaceae bacterium]